MSRSYRLKLTDPGPVSEALLKYDTLRGATGAYGVNNYVSDDRFAALTFQGILLVYTGVTIFSGGLTGALFKE